MFPKDWSGPVEISFVIKGSVITHRYMGGGETLFSAVSAHTLVGRPRVLSEGERGWQGEVPGGVGWAGTLAVEHEKGRCSVSQPRYPDLQFLLVQPGVWSWNPLWLASRQG